MSLHIAILYGSVRGARAGIRVVRFLEAALRRRGHATQVVDAAELHLPLLDRKVDAFAIVSGEYNHGIPPGLKNLVDHFLEEYFFQPSAIVCYSAGQFG